MVDATPKQCLRASNPFEGAQKWHGEVFDRVGPSIRQFFFREFPHPFIGIEFRRVGRKQLEVQARVTTTHFTNRIAFVDRRVVPNDHHWTAQMLEQLNEEQTCLDVADVSGEQLEVQIQTVPLRADRNAGDCGDLVAARFVPEDRSHSPWSPCLADAREKKKARFIYEDEMGTHPRGVFFTSGQRSRFHCSTPSWLRSSARRAGF